jgi:hypothetical protein
VGFSVDRSQVDWYLRFLEDEEFFNRLMPLIDTFYKVLQKEIEEPG